MTAKKPKKYRTALWILSIPTLVCVVVVVAAFSAMLYAPELERDSTLRGVWVTALAALGVLSLPLLILAFLSGEKSDSDITLLQAAWINFGGDPGDVKPKAERRPRERAVCKCGKCGETRRCTKYSFTAGKHYGTKTQDLGVVLQTTSTFSNLFVGHAAYICRRCVRRRWLRENRVWLILICSGTLLSAVAAILRWALPPGVAGHRPMDLLALAIVLMAMGLIAIICNCVPGGRECGSKIAMELDRDRLAKEGYNWLLTPHDYLRIRRGLREQRNIPR